MKSHEKTSRSIAKTISWRIVATFTTIMLVYFFTKELTLSLGIGLLEVITKLIIYYFHERFWTKVKWGINIPLQIEVETEGEDITE